MTIEKNPEEKREGRSPLLSKNDSLDLYEQEIERTGKLEHNFWQFAEYYFPDYLEFEAPEFQVEIYELLRVLDGSKKYAIAAPRGFGKSTLIMIFLIWCIVYKKKRYIIVISDSSSQAKQVLSDIKFEMNENEELVKDFGRLIDNKKKDTQDDFITFTGIRVQGYGASMKLRGRKFRQYRPDLVVVDDLENDEAVRSETQRKVLWDWFHRVVLAMGGKKCDYVVVGTILHIKSLLNRYLDPDKENEEEMMRLSDWVTRKWSAIDEYGKSIFPDMWSLDDLAAKKRILGSWAFEAEYQNNPRDPETCLFDRSWLTYWEEFSRLDSNGSPERWIRTLDGKKECRYDELEIHGAIDPRNKDKEIRSGDWFVFVTIGFCRRLQHYFLLDNLRIRATIDTTASLVLSRVAEFHHAYVCIETNNAQLLWKKVLEDKAREQSMCVRLHPMVSKGDKMMRIHRLQPIFENGRFSVKKTDGVFIDEYCDYGPDVPNDDQLDASEMAVRSFEKRVFIRSFKA